jgi:superoxide dismutase, Cu-Zn family
MTWAYYRGGLTDLSPTTEDVWDGARATAVLMGINDETTVRVTVRGLPDSATGEEYGAHLHVGPCGLDDNKAPTVGGHYNVSPLNDLGGPSVVSDQTEVWLDFDVNSDGEARDTAVVPFVPAAGIRSITFHATHTAHDTSQGTVGTAGVKLACIPVDIKEFASTN